MIVHLNDRHIWLYKTSALREYQFAVFFLVILLLNGITFAFENLPGLAEIPLVVIDDNATKKATINCHNQKIVQNRNGIFLNYVYTFHDTLPDRGWRLLCSTNKGVNFTKLFENDNAFNVPVMVTDSLDNLYIMHTSNELQQAFLYRFLAKNKYHDPLISVYPNYSGSKFSLVIDEPRGRLYFKSKYGPFLILDLEGNILSQIDMTRDSQVSRFEYPYLYLDANGTLHMAWTNDENSLI